MEGKKLAAALPLGDAWAKADLTGHSCKLPKGISQWEDNKESSYLRIYLETYPGLFRSTLSNAITRHIWIVKFKLIKITSSGLQLQHHISSAHSVAICG